ncbi:DUF6249 domain-containing protein [Kangiella koreensis]|uniref:Uncharacterized protein n=1 Tax=Kangiella koreensis (strain DSM 16069 / JCM 12317 / KCTC 12182 / SW-125) TaxID=523791 RepID=C7RBL8_KANKD|nr:DUF6249 domain-containing protein [Kangiella koreensis]ACV26660.1 hypothetical protein Kkor_1241 [Kangiella koreensis DSM 16069]
MNNDIVEIMVPAIVFSTIAILAISLLLYKYKIKRLFLNTTQDSLQHNPDITPEVIREIANQVLRPSSDIKKGLLLIGFSAAILVGSFIADFPDNGNMDLNDLINGIAAFPGVMGIVFLLLAKFDKN